MDLFPEEKNEKPTTYINLDRDASLWDDYITNQVKKVVKATPVTISVVWNKRDDKKGTAVGSVIIKSTADENRFVVVPIIINDFNMAPLDVIMLPGSGIDTFTPENIEKYLFSPNPAITTVPREDLRDLRNLNKAQEFSDITRNNMGFDLMPGYSPSVAAYQKTSSLLVSVLPTVSAEHIEKILEKPEILKIASPITDVLKESVRRKRMKRIEAAQKTGPDKYIVYSNTPDAFNPTISVMSGDQLVMSARDNELPYQFIAQVEAEGPDGVVLEWEKRDPESPLMAGQYKDEKRYSKITKPGIYQIYVGPGAPNIIGLVTDRNYDIISDSVSTKYWHVLSGAGGGKQSGDVYGFPINDVALPEKEPAAGDYGYFVYVDEVDYKDPIVVGPCTIEVASKRNFGYADPDDILYRTDSIKVRFDSPTVYEIRFSSFVNGSGFVKDKMGDKSFYLVSRKNITWVPIRKQINVKKPVGALDKRASIRYDGYFYEIDGDGIPGEWKHIDSDVKMSFFLRCCGYPLEKIASVLKEAKKQGYTKTEIRVPLTEKKASAQYKIYPELLKLAGYFDDISTVDTILGLNFITPENASNFLRAIDKIQKVREELLRLLLLSRIGNIEVKENLLKQGIDTLEKIIDGLKLFKAKQQ